MFSCIYHLFSAVPSEKNGLHFHYNNKNVKKKKATTVVLLKHVTTQASKIM